MEASGGASRGDTRTRRTARAQGHIEKLESGSLRVRVYAGHDKLLHKPLYLKETISAGSDAEERAEQVRVELLEKVRVGNHPRSDATVDQLWAEYREKKKWGRKTRDTNTAYYRKHIKPFLGQYKINNGYLDGDLIGGRSMPPGPVTPPPGSCTRLGASVMPDLATTTPLNRSYEKVTGGVACCCEGAQGAVGGVTRPARCPHPRARRPVPAGTRRRPE
jgi:hypothetical protein